MKKMRIISLMLIFVMLTCLQSFVCAAGDAPKVDVLLDQTPPDSTGITFGNLDNNKNITLTLNNVSDGTDGAGVKTITWTVTNDTNATVYTVTHTFNSVITQDTITFTVPRAGYYKAKTVIIDAFNNSNEIENQEYISFYSGEAPYVDILLDTTPPTLNSLVFGEMDNNSNATVTASGISDGTDGSGFKNAIWKVTNEDNEIIYTTSHLFSTTTTQDSITFSVPRAGSYYAHIELIDAFGNSSDRNGENSYNTVGKTFSNHFTATLSQNTFIYDGTTHEPTVTVKDGNKTLTRNTDYTLSYEGGLDVGTGRVHVTGMGLYLDDITLEFTITKRTLNVSADNKSRGLGQQNPTLTYSFTNNVEGEIPGFTGSLATTANDASPVGTYPITVGNLEMDNNGAFKVSNYNMSFTNGTLTVNDYGMSVSSNGYTGVYDGQEHGITVTVNTPSSGYSVMYGSSQGNYTQSTSLTRKDVGETIVYFQVTAAGYNTFEGFEVISISKKSLKDPSITARLLTTEYIYNGQNRTPGVEVKDNGVTLRQGTDYEVNYSNNKDVGTGKVTITEKGNYTGTIELTFTIKKATITVTPQNKTKVYGTEDPEFTFTHTGVATGETAAFSGALSRETGENVGTYIIQKGSLKLIDGTEFTANNYDLKVTSGRYLEITKKDFSSSDITATISETNIIYDGTAKTPAVVVKDGGRVLSNTDDYTLNYTNNTNAGTATVTVTGKNNYSGTITLTFEIGKRELKVIPDDLFKGYGAVDPTLTYIFNNVVNGETPTFSGTLTRNPGEEIGTYEIKAGTLSIQNGDHFLKDNYYLDVEGGHFLSIGEKSINGPTITVTLSENTFVYDGTAKTPTVTVKDGTTTLEEGNDYSLVYTNNIDVGTATVRIIGENNYHGERTETFTITPATIIVTPDSLSKLYGESDPEFTYTYIGNAVSETPGFDGTLTRNAGESVGEYEILRGTLALKENGNFKETNYTLNVVTGKKLKIEPKSLTGLDFTATLPITTYTYNGNQHRPTPVVKERERTLVAGTDYELSYDNNKDVGTATITITGRGGYKDSITLTFAIIKKAITITPDSLSKEFGALDPTLTYQVSGLVTGEQPNYTGALTRAIGEERGQYEIYIGTLKLENSDTFKESNYDITFTSGIKFTIGSYSLNDPNITAFLDNTTYVYDGTNHKPIPTIKNGSQILMLDRDYEISYSNNKDVGTGKVTITGIGNYTGTRELEFTITVATIVLTPDNKTKVFGTSDPAFTYSLSGVAAGETAAFNGSISRVPGENVGTYEILRGTLQLKTQGTFKESNYTLSFITGKQLTITAVSLTDDNVTAVLDNTTFVYDGTGHTPHATVKNGSTTLIEGTDYVITYENNKNAGTATAIITGSGNYTGTKTLTFTITKRKLQVKADNQTRNYGDPIGELTYTYAGQVGTETPGFTGALSTTATQESLPGTYIISIGDLGLRTNGTFIESNYEVEFTNGTLTITSVQIEVVAVGYNGVVDGNEHTITVTVINPVSGYTIMYGTTEGNYSLTPVTRSSLGSTTVYFEVTAPGYVPYRGSAVISLSSAGLANARIRLDPNTYVYDGTPKTPTAIVEANGVQLVQGTDYTVSYVNNTNAGLATAIITGTGNYNGTRNETFTIEKAPLVVKPTGNYTKIYQDVDPTFNYTITGLKNGETASVAGRIDRGEGENVGKYEINSIGTLTFITNGRFNPANYNISFERNESFLTINPRDISSGTVTYSDTEYIFNGEPQTPNPILVVNNTVLQREMDYTFTCTNNVNAGTANIIMTGKGNYTGTKNATFEIKKLDISKNIEDMTLDLNPTSFTYDGTPKEPDTLVKYTTIVLNRNTDYTVSYENNVEVGIDTASAKITGKGNYEGDITGYFSILPADISGLIELSEVRFEYDGTPKEPKIVRFVTSDGRVLVAGVDYDTTYENNINVGNARVVATGKSHFEGTVYANFEIYKTTPVVTLTNKVSPYTGHVQSIDVGEVKKVYNYGGDPTGAVAVDSLQYNYYTDVDLNNKLNSQPKDPGIYYVQAYLPGDSNHNEALSNVVRFIIFGNPIAPKIQGNDGTIIVPNGGKVKDEIFINIFGSEVENAKELQIGYKYSEDGNTWMTYSDTLHYTNEGTITIRAKAYIVDFPSMESDEFTTYTVIIDKTPPTPADVIIPDETDTVVIEVEIDDDEDEIEEIFITEDPNKVPDDDDDWQDVGNDEGEEDKAIHELSQGDEEKTIYIWEKDAAGNIAGPIVKTIVLNATKVGNMNDNKTNIYFKVTDKYLHTSNITKNDVDLLVNGFDTTGKITSLTNKPITNGYSYTGVMEDVTGNGALTIIVDNDNIFDKAGNHPSDSDQLLETKEIYVDNTLPLLKVTVKDDKATIHVDDEHIKALMVNGSIIGRSNGDYVATLRVGKNIITAMDEYGNNVSETVNIQREIVSISSVANSPALPDGLKPVYYEGNNKIITDYFTKEMYSYITPGDSHENTSSEWANAISEDGSEWVWIPRFAYKTIYYTDETLTVLSDTRTNYIDYDVIFLRERGNDYIDTNGKINSLPSGYVVAKAFTKAGGAGSELRGLWISKYEISRENSSDNGSSWVEGVTNENILTQNAGNTQYVRAVSKDNRTPWKNINVSNAFKNAEAMLPESNSHLMKNSEYEATLILGLSEFGRNGNLITLDNSDKTGGDNSTSTTGNKTGVFDIIGGSWEYTASYINGSGLTTNAEALVNSSDANKKEVLTAQDINNLTLSKFEKTIFGETTPYQTSLVIYRGLDSSSTNISSTPVGGIANAKIGYRAVLSQDTASGSASVSIYGAYISGPEFNQTIKKLAGDSSANYESENTNIKAFEWQSSKPSNTILNASTTKNVGLNTGAPIYAWFDNGTVKLWSEANNIDINSDCSNMFKKFKGLTSIDFIRNLHINNNNTVTNMNSMFFDCENLTAINLAGLNTKNVTNMSYLFCLCKNATNINISTFDLSNVTNTSYMFDTCSNLQVLTMTTSSTPKLTKMTSMFKGCEKLGNIDLSHLNTSKVTDMSYLFCLCKNMTNINISSFKFEKVENLSYMFDTCSNVKTINLPASGATNSEKVQNMTSMFKGCSELTNLNLKGLTSPNVEDMKYMFCQCSKLESIDLSTFSFAKVTDMSYMFDYCIKVKSIILPTSSTPRLTNMQNMFKKCEELQTIDLSYFTTSNVTNMLYAFDTCKKLTTIYASSSFATGNVTVANSKEMFNNCDLLKGGSGTTYNWANANDKTYAHIDGGTSNPGYFTAKT